MAAPPPIVPPQAESALRADERWGGGKSELPGQRTLITSGPPVPAFPCHGDRKAWGRISANRRWRIPPTCLFAGGEIGPLARKQVVGRATETSLRHDVAEGETRQSLRGARPNAPGPARDADRPSDFIREDGGWKGRPQDPRGNTRARWMAIPRTATCGDKTRLIGCLLVDGFSVQR